METSIKGLLAHRLGILAHEEREVRTQLLYDRNGASNGLGACLKLDD